MARRAVSMRNLEPAIEVATRALSGIFPRLVTLVEVARHWRVSPEAIPYWIRKGWLPPPTIGPSGKKYFPASVLQAPAPPEDLLKGIDLKALEGIGQDKRP